MAAAAAVWAAARDGYTFPVLAMAWGLLTSSQIVVAGIVAGLLSDPPHPERHSLSRPLTRLCLGLSSVSIPVIVFVSIREGDLTFLVSYVIGTWTAAGFCAIVTAVTLTAFNRCPTDEPVTAEPPANGRIQFSLRQLIGLTTLVALACATPRWLADQDSLMGALAWLYVIILGMTAAFGTGGLLLVGIPLTVFLGRHPWRNAALGLILAMAIVNAPVVVLVSTESWRWFPWQLPVAAGVHLSLVIASLGVLRGCGLRLVQRMPNDSFVEARVFNTEFATWPHDDRAPVDSERAS
jgi:hypothetical protein